MRPATTTQISTLSTNPFLSRQKKWRRSFHDSVWITHQPLHHTIRRSVLKPSANAKISFSSTQTPANGHNNNCKDQAEEGSPRICTFMHNAYPTSQAFEPPNSVYYLACSRIPNTCFLSQCYNRC